MIDYRVGGIIFMCDVYEQFFKVQKKNFAFLKKTILQNQKIFKKTKKNLNGFKKKMI